MQPLGFDTILCPVDFSELSGHALRAAARLAVCKPARVIAAYANWFEVPAYFTQGRIEELNREFTESVRMAERALEAFVKSTLGDQSAGVETRVELEFLTGWFLDGERKKQSDLRKQSLLTAAEALGARHVKVGDFLREKCPMPRLIEAFAALCADGAEHGTKISFELMPFSMLDTLKDSLTMVEGAGAKNGGISFDLWHIVKLGIPYEEVARVPPQYIVSVELNDGTFQAPWDLHEDTVNHRRFCGEGEFDIRGFIAQVQRAGYTGPWGIEVLSEDLRKMPLEQATTHAFNTTIAQFRQRPSIP